MQENYIPFYFQLELGWTHEKLSCPLYHYRPSVWLHICTAWVEWSTLFHHNRTAVPSPPPGPAHGPLSQNLLLLTEAVKYWLKHEYFEVA